MDNILKNTKFLSRKFILAVLCVFSASLLCWYGHIADGIYSVILVTAIGAYNAANVLQQKT